MLLTLSCAAAYGFAPLFAPPVRAPLEEGQRAAAARSFDHPVARARTRGADACAQPAPSDFEREVRMWAADARHASMVWAARSRRDVFNALLRVEEELAAQEAACEASPPLERAAASHYHAACHAVCDGLYELLYPSEFGAVRRWHARQRGKASLELASAERRIGAVLPYALPRKKATLSSRVKTASSVFEKARMRGSRVDDLLALRVILEDRPGAAQPALPSPSAEAQRPQRAAADDSEDISNCHTVRTLVGAIYPGAIVGTKDYLASPKGNGYRSLHLSVRLPSGAPLEVQIRTQRMHELAEHGAASHAAYKANLRDSWLPPRRGERWRA